MCQGESNFEVYRVSSFVTNTPRDRIFLEIFCTYPLPYLFKKYHVKCSKEKKNLKENIEMNWLFHFIFYISSSQMLSCPNSLLYIEKRNQVKVNYTSKLYSNIMVGAKKDKYICYYAYLIEKCSLLMSSKKSFPLASV